MVGSSEVVFPLPPIDIQQIINFGIHLNHRKNNTKNYANKKPVQKTKYANK